MKLRARTPRTMIVVVIMFTLSVVLFPVLAQTLPGSWERLADAPTIRSEASYVNLNGKLHLVGGIKAHHVYDPVTNSWSTKAPMPVKLNHVQGVVVGGKIYVIGGLISWPGGDVNTVYIYDPGTNAWTQGASMPFGRGAGATVVHNGKIYYAGGLHAGVAVSNFDVYDPATNSWSSLPNMPRAREHFHAAVANGKLWAIGGRTVAINSTISQTDAFNFATGQWETGFAPIPTKRGGFGVGVAGNEIIVFGGEGGGISKPAVEAYDTSTNTWRQLAPMAVPRHGIQVAECNGAYYIATGSTDQGGGSASAYNDVFRLTSGTGCGSGGGGGGGTTPIGFGVSSLSGTTGSSPTTLAWGPDGRLYVGYMFGVIRAYAVTRDGPNSYRVTSTETINGVANLPNRNDSGQLVSTVTGRLLLGIALTGTASNPVIYASSSDPRIGGGAEGTDLNLDTNSGTLSRLSWTGSSWQHTILVQGLPRSEENHGPNGMALSSNGNTLYWAYGGNTNKGGPSNNFANLPEYAYSAAILSVDLAAIGNSTYTMPTLDDPSRGSASGPNQNDVNDPFGGNDGANQARITAGSPVQVFAPGFRNPYDLVIATTGSRAGKMYTPDNGPNGGWGDMPVGEGTANCTNQTVGQAETGANDALHLVTPGYYGGHANPTRGNANNTFNGQSPVLSSNPVECDFRSSKTSETTSISLLPNSSNGIAEYTTDNFGGAMTGNLVIASYQARKVVRIALNSTGTSVTLREDNFATFDTGRPLDVVTMGSTQAFPGTIWIADITANEINVMEPNDFGGGGGGGGGCTGQDTTSLDEDGDGYSNADEIDNGTNPCSAASKPPDNDGDGLSDLNDPNDDNDGLADLIDPFAIDPTNGTNTGLPVVISWENDQAPPGGIANTGFTGLMTNGKTNYLNQFDENGMVVGGAAGVFTVSEVPAGDAGGLKNNQMYAFQLGVDAPSAKFQVVGRIVEPFSGLTAGAHQQMGIFIGDGTQDGYVKLVLKGTDTNTEQVHLLREEGGTVLTRRSKGIVLPGPNFVDLRLVVDPAAGTVQGFAQASVNGVLQPQIMMGNPVPIPMSWLTSTTRGLATGLISTSVGPAPPFPATWDFFHVEPV